MPACDVITNYGNKYINENSWDDYDTIMTNQLCTTTTHIQYPTICGMIISHHS